MKKLFYTLLLIAATCLPGFSQGTFPVRFSHGTEFFPENFANVRQNPKVAAEALVNGQYTRYIQLEKVMNARERADFEATGAQVIGYVQFGAYLVLLPENFDFQKIESFLPRSVVPVLPEWKMASSLREPPYGAWAVHGDYLDLNLQVYPSLSIPEGAALCRKQGLDVLKEGTQNGFVQVRAHKDQLNAIAAMPFVQYLELVPPPGQKEDTRGRSLHRSNLVDSDYPTGKKYNGAGVSLLVRDDGELGPHIDLQGRLYNYATPPNTQTHGDGVVGIMGGAGNLDPTIKGMAAGADLYSVDYVNDFQDLTLPLHLNEGVTLTNSSYSDGCNFGYTLATQTVDQQLFENPTLMHVFSGGNSNDFDCGYGAGNQWGNITGGHKMAKNAIATANVYADAVLVQSSSRGPAYDGRLKPDITANGQDQESLAPDNGYQTFGGTSGAAPGIAGCLAQLTQAFRTIQGVNDAPSALLKATILNTANDLGNVGPDFKFGWGHINAWRALRLLEQQQWLEGDADQGLDLTHTIQIPNGVKEAKIMLYWAEPPSQENNAKALINDLDLRVASSAGTISLPWKLDPTPDPIILDTPAGKGRDSLNNMEQVLIENPVAGAYTVHINGTEVPMGPQHYYLVWEFIRDEIKVTYPAGGEGMVPGEVERIHWDAYGNSGMFTLRYSLDGITFTNIANVPGDKRMYDWTVPNKVSGKVYFMAIRGAKRDTTDVPCTIAPVPQNLQVTKVCPDSITLSWAEVNDTLTYDGYLLGEKYMEIKGATDSNSVAMPIQNGVDGQWLSVRTSHPDGTAGRRAVAIYWPGGGLLGCPQSYDLALSQVVSPEGNAIVSCGSSDLTITVRINNEGQNTATGATAYYQTNNDPPVSEALPDIPTGGSLDFSFQVPLAINFNGNITFKTWIAFPDDAVEYNDTITRNYIVVAYPLDQSFIENFEALPTLPLGWAIINPDVFIGWEMTDELPFAIVGPDDLIGRSAHLNFYDYGPGNEGEEDYLYMIPIDLTDFSAPRLTFKVAHAQFDNTYSDALRVDVFDNCDLGAPFQTIWEKTDPELATVPAQTSYYYPGNGSEWRTEEVDLSAFVGKKITVRFATTNGYGNSLYLDDIGIVKYELPAAEFAAPDSICRLDTVVYEANPVFGATYAWSFGTAALPATATGVGPHTVVYPTAGNKTVRLIVSNSFGLDTMVQVVTVRQLATANFTTTQNLLTATFNNTSTNATSYLWDFGDGNTSTLASPVHTYAAPGTYTVKLSATNACRTHEKTLTVGVTGVNELAERIGIQILPNPTAGDFAVELDSRITGSAQLSLFDAAGRKVSAQDIALKQGRTRIEFNNLNLPKGLYQLNVLAEGKQATFSIAVQ